MKTACYNSSIEGSYIPEMLKKKTIGLCFPKFPGACFFWKDIDILKVLESSQGLQPKKSC